ncbi:MAG TPA: hypothetical protein EYP86_04880 [Candidatus Altiarchaeales archaeon]|nr:hypothetical protein [Candidatus Altiarchaeales archaeon]
MKLLANINLKWYDDTALMLEDREDLVKLFLGCLGVSRDVASDLFEVLLIAKKDGISLTSKQIKREIIKLRKLQGMENPEHGLSDRNIQIWLKFFRNLEMVERLGDRYLFKKNKTPSNIFIEKTKPEVIDKCSDFMYKLLKEIEKRYEIEK